MRPSLRNLRLGVCGVSVAAVNELIAHERLGMTPLLFVVDSADVRVQKAKERILGAVQTLVGIDLLFNVAVASFCVVVVVKHIYSLCLWRSGRSSAA